jgi:transcriptional regulator with XRE-family HTH domain
MDNKKIGRYLLNKRKEENKTQKEVAEDLGVTYQAVSRWENGDSIPDIETLCMIADLYHVTVDEILQRESNGNENGDMVLLGFMSVFVYVVALLAFLVINSIWIPLIGLALFIVFSMGGLFPSNLYYFYELEVRTKKDTIVYLLSYVPLLIGIIIIIAIY